MNKGETLCGNILESGKDKNHKPKEKRGAEKLRNIVEWMNARPETLNQNKDIIELIMEFSEQK